MKGFRQIFAFTLKQQLRVKTVKTLTIALALLFFLVPALLMPLAEMRQQRSEEPASEEPGDEVPEEPFYPVTDGSATFDASSIGTIFYFSSFSDLIDPHFLEKTAVPGLEQLSFVCCASEEDALQRAGAQTDALALLLTEENSYTAQSLVRPEGTAVPQSNAYYASECISGAWTLLLMREMGLSDDEIAEAGADIEAYYEALYAEEELTAEEYAAQSILSVLRMALPYVNLMLVYFLVLYYGQSVANVVILEKSSKLMDTFLVAVSPRALELGKLLATWCAALAQFFTWVAAAVAGCAAGAAAVRSINPDSTLGIMKAFRLMKSAAELFDPARVVLAILLILAGFLLYCSLAAIAGSVVSKTEELSSTIGVFSLVLVVSFLATLRTGTLLGGEGVALWTCYVPFTAVLSTPSYLLIGDVTFLTGLISLLIMLAAAFVLVLVAARLYELLALYKGAVTSLPRLLAMLRESFRKERS